MRIGVYGSAGDGIRPEIEEKAREIGAELASRMHELVFGACPGYPYEAAMSAIDNEGQVTGFSPAVNFDNHEHDYRFPVESVGELRFVPSEIAAYCNRQVSLKYRNIMSVRYVDAGIIIGGQTGTLNEFTLLYDSGKDIGVLKGSGGIADSLLAVLACVTKDRGSRIIFDENPKELVKRLTELPR